MVAPRKMLDWAGIEIEYKAGQRPVTEIAREFNTSHTTINRRASERGWVRAGEDAVRQRAGQIMAERTAAKVKKQATRPTQPAPKPAVAEPARAAKQAAEREPDVAAPQAGAADGLKPGEVSAPLREALKERIRERDEAVESAAVGLFHDESAAERAEDIDAGIADDLIEANARVQVVVRERHRRDIGEARALVGDMVGELRAETGGKAEFEQAIKAMVEQGFPEVALAINKAVSLPTRASTADRLVASMQKLVAMEREAYGIDEDKGGGGIEELLRKVHASG